MRKLHLLLILAILCMVPQVFGQSRDLVLYTWEEMFPQEILNSFERETGIRVIYRTFETNEEMWDNLVENSGGAYDLVIADDYIVELVTYFGLAQRLNKSRIPNFSNIDSFFQRKLYDPDDEYTVPYGAGVKTIVYDPSRVSIDIRGLGDLWDSSLRNSVGIMGNYRVINGMALKTMGKSYNNSIVTDIAAAGKFLMQLIPNIRIMKDFGLEEDLIAGNISVAVMYTDQVMKSRLERPELRAVFPSEGIGFGTMPAFIPVGAPNADAAHRFLNYILDPERGARCFEYLGYYCTFDASKRYINPRLEEFLIMPQFTNFESMHNINQEAEDEHWRVWEIFTEALGNR